MFLFFGGLLVFARVSFQMESGASTLGLDSRHTVVHFGPRVYAWLLQALAGWPAGGAGRLPDWLAVSLANWLLGLPGLFSLGVRFVFSFSGYACAGSILGILGHQLVSGASALVLETKTKTRSWLAGWLNGLLAGSLASRGQVSSGTLFLFF